jgi:hypothetical protein
LRRSAKAASLPGTGYCRPIRTQRGEARRVIAALFNDRPRMPPRLLKYFWRSLDHAMPDGPPILLVFLIAVLLVANGFVAFSRW